MIDRYMATLAGVGYGDTLGMSVEGWKKTQIEKYVGRVTRPIAPVIVRDANGEVVLEDEFGKLKYWTRDLSEGDSTDDTVLTIPIAGSIIEHQGFNMDDIMARQTAEYVQRLEPSGHVIGGFGRTTKDAFENFRNGKPALECGIYPGLGTGPCMKISPVGLYMHATGRKTEGLEAARLIGLETHLDERALACGIVQANAVYDLLNGVSRENFVNSTVACCKKYEKMNTPNYPKAEKGTLLDRLKWIRDNKDVSQDESKKVLGCSSLAIEAYPFTVFMFQKYWDNPVEGLIETVNFGGDCDTTGAMYGALCGAKNGMIFPADWKLNDKEKLCELGRGLYALGEKS